MFEYAVRRVLLLFPTIFIGSLALFAALTYLPPQDAVELRIPAEQQVADPTLVENQRRALGLYGPFHERYFRWAKGFVTGDWGKSLSTQRDIAKDLIYRIPVSFELSFIGLFVTWAISFPLGVFAAVRQDTRMDYVLRTSAYALDALPSFVLGIVLLTFLAVYFNWAPPPTFSQIWENPGEHFRILALPALIIGVTSAGNLLRLTRTFLLEIMRQDFVRTARSKGLPEHRVLMRHALRNVALPFITVIGASIPTLLTSSAIIENLFSLPGMGRYLVSAASGLDYPVVMTTTVFYGIIILLTQLLTDLSYAYFDPRVSYSRGA